MAPDLRYSDRTAIGKLETGRDEWLAAFRQQVEMTAGPLVPRVLATRGERLALVRMLWRGAGGDVGESELDWLLLIEVDRRGDHSAVVTSSRATRGRVRELDARYAAVRVRGRSRVRGATATTGACLAQFARLPPTTTGASAGAGRSTREWPGPGGAPRSRRIFPPRRSLRSAWPGLLTQVAQVGAREEALRVALPLRRHGRRAGPARSLRLYDVEGSTPRGCFDALAAAPRERPSRTPHAQIA
jgi:hypothetical protein